MSPAPRKHTPGPWSLSPSFDRVERRVQHGDAPALVWSIASGINSAHPDYLPRAEQIANARLIAAAPELLAALEDMTDRYARAMKDSGVSHYPEAMVEIRSARAAIAKATAN